MIFFTSFKPPTAMKIICYVALTFQWPAAGGCSRMFVPLRECWMINILNFYMQYGLVSLLQCTVLPMQAKICINKIKITKNTSFMKKDYVLQLVTCNLLMCSTFWANLNDIRKAESENHQPSPSMSSSQASPFPSPSVSLWSLFRTLRQLSQASPKISWSLFLWLTLGTKTQLSCKRHGISHHSGHESLTST